ncbi:MAG: hypothetical protein ACJARX_001065 [Psychroserpens sp.]|jgi:hypothetical protein
MAVYTPNILGYVFLSFLVLLAILFIAFLMLDINKKRISPILWRTVSLLLGILIFLLIKKVDYL